MAKGVDYRTLVEPVWLPLNRSWDDGPDKFLPRLRSVRPEVGHLYAATGVRVDLTPPSHAAFPRVDLSVHFEVEEFAEGLRVDVGGREDLFRQVGAGAIEYRYAA